MRKFFAVALGSMVALAGFAGAANASATVDLIWIDVSTLGTDGNPACLKPNTRNCPFLGSSMSNVATSEEITLLVLVTAGPQGVIGAALSVDYTELIPEMSVSGFQSLKTTKPLKYLPAFLGTTTDIHAT